ncbi:MAG: ABC transporter permease [Planctomycetota bacterium]|nr:ABC transporter permease [Planctomycetota bacterium]
MWKMGVQNLFSRPARSLLSILGLTVAIMGMVGLFSVARGIDALMSNTFKRVPGLIVLQTGAPVPLFSRLPEQWEPELKAMPELAVVNAELWQRANVVEGKMVVSPPRFLFGTDIATRKQLKHCVYQTAMIEGRFLIESDRNQPNVVVSRAIAKDYKKAIGDTLRINGDVLTIVGMYDTGLMLLDVAIIMDISTARTLTRFGEGSVSAYYLETQEGLDSETVAVTIEEHFRGREVPAIGSESLLTLNCGNGKSLLGNLLGSILNGTPKPTTNDTTIRENSEKSTALGETSDRAALSDTVDENMPVEVRSPEDWVERFEKINADLELILGVLTAIGVTVAVLSIVNTMLMSVTERVIEFGILKANGWTNGNVLRLILSESATIGVFGGIFGSSFGWGATVFINWKWSERIHLYASPGLLVFSVVFSIVMGTLGGLYPAWWATRMMPVDAIRRG